MAIFNRNKEIWNPKNRIAKTSKNRTFENKYDSGPPDTLNVNSRLLFYWPGNDSTGVGLDENAYIIKETSATGWNIQRLEADGVSISPGYVNNAPFTQPMVQFGDTSYLKHPHASQNHKIHVWDDLLAPHHRDIFISFRINIPSSSHANTSSGHSFAALKKTGSTTISGASPFISLFVTANRQIGIRFTGQRFNNTNPAVIGTDVSMCELLSEKQLATNTWHNIVFYIPAWQAWGPAYWSSHAPYWKVFIDGVDETSGNPIVNTAAAGQPGGTHAGLHQTASNSGITSRIWGWDLGSTTVGYGVRDNNDLYKGEGFTGKLSQFAVFAQGTGVNGASDNYAARYIAASEIAKFVNEAYKTGVHALHSGIHSPGWRAAAIDKEREGGYYPYLGGSDFRRFGADRLNGIRGELTGDEYFLYKEARYDSSHPNYGSLDHPIGNYLPTEYSVPYLKLGKNSSITDPGIFSFYSEERSKIFQQDVDDYAMTYQSSQERIDYKHMYSKPELYRRPDPEFAADDKALQFLDRNIDPESEYSKDFYIDIPIPNVASTLNLSSRGSGESSRIQGGWDSAGSRIFSYENNGGLASNIHTMAYYNFTDEKWEYAVADGFKFLPTGGSPNLNKWVKDADIGFGPMSGLLIPVEEELLEPVIDTYGRPTSAFGFPFHNKFEASPGQELDLSKYLPFPAILKGWEIKMDITAAIGEDQAGAPAEPELYYTDSSTGSGNFRSPFFYGVHGDSCTYYEKASINHFGQPPAGHVTNGSNKSHYQYGNTVPVSEFTTIGDVETQNETSLDDRGLLTKGVTVFLMKQNDYSRNNPEIVQSFMNTENQFATYSNWLQNVGTNFHSGYTLGMPSGTAVALQETESVSSTNPWGAGLWETGFFTGNTKTGNYTGKKNRELIGYLQTVIHNDAGFNKPREYWTRPQQTSGNGHVQPDYERSGLVLGDLFHREDTKYVETSQLIGSGASVSLHMSGSTKSNSQMASGVPVTNFTMRSHNNQKLSYGSGDIPTINSQQTGFDFAANHANYYATAVVPSYLGNTGDGTIMASRNIPCTAGDESDKSTIIPNALFPIVDDETKFAGILSSKELTKNPENSCAVLLHPTDKLVLGIQDSISTTLGSQHIPGDDGTTFGTTWSWALTTSNNYGTGHTPGTYSPVAQVSSDGSGTGGEWKVVIDNSGNLSIVEQITAGTVTYVEGEIVQLANIDGRQGPRIEAQSLLGVTNHYSTSRKFVKWGRNLLTIPPQGEKINNQWPHSPPSYIRLYLEKHRAGKKYAAESNQSHGFSPSVNKSLGDHLNMDQYEVESLMTYKGSMADELVFPHPMVPAEVSIPIGTSNQFPYMEETLWYYAQAGNSSSNRKKMYDIRTLNGGLTTGQPETALLSDGLFSGFTALADGAAFGTASALHDPTRFNTTDLLAGHYASALSYSMYVPFYKKDATGTGVEVTPYRYTVQMIQIKTNVAPLTYGTGHPNASEADNQNITVNGQPVAPLAGGTAVELGDLIFVNENSQIQKWVFPSTAAEAEKFKIPLPLQADVKLFYVCNDYGSVRGCKWDSNGVTFDEGNGFAGSNIKADNSGVEAGEGNEVYFYTLPYAMYLTVKQSLENPPVGYTAHANAHAYYAKHFLQPHPWWDSNGTCNISSHTNPEACANAGGTWTYASGNEGYAVVRSRRQFRDLIPLYSQILQEVKWYVGAANAPYKLFSRDTGEEITLTGTAGSVSRNDYSHPLMADGLTVDTTRCGFDFKLLADAAALFKSLEGNINNYLGVMLWGSGGELTNDRSLWPVDIYDRFIDYECIGGRSSIHYIRDAEGRVDWSKSAIPPGQPFYPQTAVHFTGWTPSNNSPNWYTGQVQQLNWTDSNNPDGPHPVMSITEKAAEQAYATKVESLEEGWNYLGGDHEVRPGYNRHLIDGKALFSTTDGTAGPFGSLAKFAYTIDDEYTYLDSQRIPLDILGNDIKDYSHTAHWDHDWPFEKYTNFEPYSLQRMETFLVPLNATSYVTPPDQTYDGQWSNGMYTNLSTVQYTGTATEIEVTNYIEDAFSEYSSDDLTFRMIFLGFGPGLRGKHELRDHFEYTGTDGTGNNYSGTSSLNTPIYTKLMLSKIRGFRLGLSGIRPQKRGYHFSRTRYGHFSDLLEFSVDGAYESGIPEGPFEDWVKKSPVKIVGRDPGAPRLEKALNSTNRNNKLVGAQITTPYTDNQNDPRTVTADGLVSQGPTASVSLDGSVTVDLVNAIDDVNSRD